MKFRVKQHSIRSGVDVVEVYDDRNRFLATLMQGNNDQRLRVISKHIVDARVDPGLIPSVEITLRESRDPPKPQEVVDGPAA